MWLSIFRYWKKKKNINILFYFFHQNKLIFEVWSSLLFLLLTTPLDPYGTVTDSQSSTLFLILHYSSSSSRVSLLEEPPKTKTEVVEEVKKGSHGLGLCKLQTHKPIPN